MKRSFTIEMRSDDLAGAAQAARADTFRRKCYEYCGKEPIIPGGGASDEGSWTD